MSDSLKPLAIIPARGGSKRFPRKNAALLEGVPLVVRAVQAAEASGIFGKICVSSDDPEILALVGEDYARKRSEQLAGDTVQVKTVCLALLDDLESEGEEYESFGILLPTSPLRRPEDLRGAYQALKASGADVVMSVVSYAHPPQRALAIREGKLVPFFETGEMKRTQDLEPLYRHDGSSLFVNTEAFRRQGEFYCEKLVPYEIPVEYSADVDSPEDLEWCEFLLKRMTANNG